MATKRRSGEYPILSSQTIAVVFLLLLGGAVAAIWWLLHAYSNSPDVLAVCGIVVIGAGALGSWWLAARRQQLAERTLRENQRALWHAERALQHTEFDAAQRRMAELYTAAAGQLSAGQETVRLAGLCALEAAAHHHPPARESVVNLLCALLRGPVDEQPRVRAAVQRVLAKHLRPEAFWPDVELDLSGAELTDVDLSGCEVAAVRFTGAVFHGTADFSRTRFIGDALFNDATFHGRARFDEAEFRGQAWFTAAGFHEHAGFGRTVFQAPGDFTATTFHRGAELGSAVTPADARVRLDLPFEVVREWPDGWQVRPPIVEAEGAVAGLDGVWGELVPVGRKS
ncbi:hypothetical protein D5S17_31510 [Pseudonocardiaceae bacterium YIM PH 21723]|nr:hypothetical protein D5S17_31510 [Pseudonocardiaceae bacterium YIM PH 21723]